MGKLYLFSGTDIHHECFHLMFLNRASEGSFLLLLFNSEIFSVTESFSESVVLTGGTYHLSRSTSESFSIVFHRSFLVVYILILLWQMDLFVRIEGGKWKNSGRVKGKVWLRLLWFALYRVRENAGVWREEVNALTAWSVNAAWYADAYWDV